MAIGAKYVGSPGLPEDTVDGSYDLKTTVMFPPYKHAVRFSWHIGVLVELQVVTDGHGDAGGPAVQLVQP